MEYYNGYQVSCLNISDIKKLVDRGLMKYHHTATREGYMSRQKPQGVIVHYNGRYGCGYIHMMPRWDTSRYMTYEYYIWTIPNEKE
jgi:hypothetical protein